MRHVHAVVPGGIDDASRPSGGNAYDRRVLDGLRSAGWTVEEHPVAGAWPHPDSAAVARLAAVVGEIASGSVLLVDGLVASCSAEALIDESERLRVVVLVHLPLIVGDGGAGREERRVLTAAAAVVTTSEWTRQLLVDAYALPADTVHVARPGVDQAPLAPGTPTGGSLLCVGAVSPHKGQADLADALGSVAGLPWRCVLVGSLDIAPDYVTEVRRRLSDGGIDDRVSLVGALGASLLDRAYAAADLVVVPSRTETYGMVVAEALSRGLPVLATRVGGIPESLLGDERAGSEGIDGSDGSDGRDGTDVPGLLVAPDGAGSLAVALRAWLGDDHLRSRLRARAAQRRATLSPWSRTVADVAHVLERVSRD